MQAVRFTGVGQPPPFTLGHENAGWVAALGQGVMGFAMARDGRIHAETTEFPLAAAIDVYARLKAGQITGRPVLIPA
jgi:D-arabinose 1-dehydrogenase-like Zn-dependent alcohol dehydrogenase